MKQELLRASRRTTILAINPGDVSTLVLYYRSSRSELTLFSDMNPPPNAPWAMEGLMSASTSVNGMLKVIHSKDYEYTGTAWSYNGKVI